MPRAARLNQEDLEESQVLAPYVNVGVSERAYSINVDYRKPVTDEFGVASLTTTWSTGSLGTAGGASDIVQSLSGCLDEFLAAYLRINEETCESTPQ